MVFFSLLLHWDREVCLLSGVERFHYTEVFNVAQCQLHVYRGDPLLRGSIHRGPTVTL